MTSDIRLQVALAQLGFASRRQAAEMIKAGRVKVNGATVREPGRKVDLAEDRVNVDGISRDAQKKIYLLLNKPKGVVTTVKDKYADRTILELVGHKDERIYPVGRLDKDTTGLLLLTNDGALAYRLTHPKFGVERVYQVRVQGDIGPEKLRKLEAGIILEGKKTFPCKIKMIAAANGATELEVRLKEGRKRQIKKMFGVVGHPVAAIHRTAFGPLKLAGLKSGRFRPLTNEELKSLF